MYLTQSGLLAIVLLVRSVFTVFLAITRGARWYTILIVAIEHCMDAPCRRWSQIISIIRIGITLCYSRMFPFGFFLKE